MDLEINECLEIINADNTVFQDMKKYNDTIENGAISILQGLEEFCDCMLEKYEEKAEVPYDKLFCALKQVITSALDNEKVCQALMTGIISERKQGIETITVQKKATIKKEVKKTKNKINQNLAAVSHYAKNHTIREICEHFKFNSVEECRNYCYYYKLNFKRSTSSGNKKYDEEKIRTLAKDMRLCELARTFGVTINAMGMYCLRHNITCKKEA